MGESFILSSVRTPLGFYDLPEIDLARSVSQESLVRAGVPATRLEDVYWGTSQPGFSNLFSWVTVDRSLASSGQALHFASQAILTGDLELVIVGGSQAAQTLSSQDSEILSHLSTSLESIAGRYHLTRSQADAWAFESIQRARRSIEQGGQTGLTVCLRLDPGQEIANDELPTHLASLETFASIEPLTPACSLLTEATVCRLTQGAAALAVASPKLVGRLNLSPQAIITSRAQAIDRAGDLLSALASVSRQALHLAGLSIQDVDWIELEEINALIPLAWMQEMQADPQKVNPEGGALAYGSPFHAAGAVSLTRMIHGLERTKGRYGLMLLPAGMGIATATLIERI